MSLQRQLWTPQDAQEFSLPTPTKSNYAIHTTQKNSIT